MSNAANFPPPNPINRPNQFQKSFFPFGAFLFDDPNTTASPAVRMAPGWTFVGGGASGAVLSVDGRVGAVTLSDLYDALGAASTVQGNLTTHIGTIGNGAHMPVAGITDGNVAGGAAIAWGKISKSGATASDVGAEASNANLDAIAALTFLANNLLLLTGGGTTAVGQLVDAYVSNAAAIAWAKISKIGAVASDVGAASTAEVVANVSDGLMIASDKGKLDRLNVPLPSFLTMTKRERFLAAINRNPFSKRRLFS